MENNGNIILNQIVLDNSLFSFKEIIPPYIHSNNPQTLIKNHDGSILWGSIDLSLNLIINNHFKDTEIYYNNGRVGLGRFPLFNYKIDIAVPKDTLITGFHIGDGSFGFSMGNGTTQGFIPEIIGIGSDENDTGLYFVGIAGNDLSSNIPLIILDGRNSGGLKLTNRPILGITSGKYDEYLILINSNGDIILNGIPVLETLVDLQRQINELKIKFSE